jgi:hypothetical protein
MEKKKVTLSINADIWKSFKLHCIKNDIIASDIINDVMASMVGKKPRKRNFIIK